MRIVGGPVIHYPVEVDRRAPLDAHGLGPAAPQDDSPVPRNESHVCAAVGGEHNAALDSERKVVVRRVVREARIPVRRVRVLHVAVRFGVDLLVVVEMPVVGRRRGGGGVRTGKGGGVAPVRVRRPAHRLRRRADRRLGPRLARPERKRKDREERARGDRNAPRGGLPAEWSAFGGKRHRKLFLRISRRTPRRQRDVRIPL